MYRLFNRSGIEHHFIGYLVDEIWKNYDPLGFKGQEHTITLKKVNSAFDTIHFI